MHIVYISGGFGNQLFQISFYNYLSKNNSNVYLNIDFYNYQHKILYRIIRKFRKTPIRKFHFNEHFKKNILSSKELLIQLSKINRFKAFVFYFLIFFLPINKVLKFLKYNYINENNFNTSLIEFNKFIFFDGYWQDFKFIENEISFVRNLLIQYKYFNPESFFKNQIIIHVRRGDFTNSLISNIYTTLDSYYYDKALFEITKLERKNFDIIVCSDDIEWCKKYITSITHFNNIKYSDSNNLQTDFKLIAESEFIISSNSTFCWWASIAGNSKAVIIPKNWYTQKHVKTQFISEFDKILEI
jgi:hypothetical protein